MAMLPDPAAEYVKAGLPGEAEGDPLADVDVRLWRVTVMAGGVTLTVAGPEHIMRVEVQCPGGG